MVRLVIRLISLMWSGYAFEVRVRSLIVFQSNIHVTTVALGTNVWVRISSRMS